MNTHRGFPAILLFALCLLPFLFTGCAIQQAPKAQLLASQKAYCAVVDSLTSLKLQGHFSDKDTAAVTVAVNEGADFLSRWKSAIDAGADSPDLYAEFQLILDRLIAYQIAKESKL